MFRSIPARSIRLPVRKAGLRLFTTVPNKIVKVTFKLIIPFPPLEITNPDAHTFSDLKDFTQKNKLKFVQKIQDDEIGLEVEGAPDDIAKLRQFFGDKSK